MATHQLPPESGHDRRSKHSKARFNPLRRTSDRVQWWAARILLVLLIVGLPIISVGAGTLVHDSELRTAQSESATRHAVTARLTENASPPNAAGPGADVPTDVRWREPDGTSRTGTAMVDAGSRKGTTVQIWVDREGKVTSAPLSTDKATAGGVMAGVLTAEVVIVLALVGWKSFTHVLDRRRYAQWDEEWAHVEPQWSRRARG